MVTLSWLGWTPQANAFTEDQKIFLQAWRIVNQAYIDDTFNDQNWWLMRQNYLRKPFDDRDDAYDAIEEMLATLDDPFTRLLRPEQYRSLQVSTSGELSGVGLQIDLAPETHQLEVVTPIAGSPAEAAGVQAGDYILEIDGFKTQDMALDEAATRMRGKIGTSVVLTVEHPEEEKTEKIKIVRDRISLNPVHAQLDTENSDTPIGYIRLSQFSANATQELKTAIQKLDNQGAEAYILDLRNNPGGLLQAGVSIARLWIDNDPIVYTVNRQGMFDSFYADHNAITDAPLAVLVNKGTASASEIVAGALQDNHRATLVGQTTFGKGLIQSLFELSDDAGLAVTVAKYETPNHTDINKQGITPDYEISQDPITVSQIGTEADLQYQKAVNLLKGNSVIAEAT
ncbi:S41 family peptidase [Spirulina sp. CS-785/01]|nr:carboxyl-terminal processing protease CtpA [Spirulina sp. CS-785/01]MDB9314002.1 S41 family peptidase [Spirulina sp. CS-785/01]